MVELELLKSLDIFKELTTEQIELVQKYCYRAEYNKGDRLFREGDDATQVWIESDGKIDLRFELPGNPPTTEDQTVTRIEARQSEAKVLGWSCFVPPYKMRLSAYCVTDRCELVKIEKYDLMRLFDQDPRIGFLFMNYLVRVVGFRFQAFQEEYARVMGEDVLNSW